MYIALFLHTTSVGEERKLVSVEGDKKDCCVIYRTLRRHHEQGAWKWPESQITGHTITNDPVGEVDIHFDKEDVEAAWASEA